MPGQGEHIKEIVEIVDEEVVEEIVENKALVLFSGGFDSTAVVLKLINEEYHTHLTLLYERNTIFEDAEETVNELFVRLRDIAETKNIVLELVIEDMNMNHMTSPADKLHGKNRIYNGDRDFCLLTHLMTILRHGEYDRIYMGWNKSNIPSLVYSKNLYKYITAYSYEGFNLLFLEDIFLDKDTCLKQYFRIEQQTKYEVIKYLLDHNMFEYCQTDMRQEEGEHWYTTSSKWKEVVYALIDLDFTHKELTRVFKNNDLGTVQKIWNRKNKATYK